MRFFLIAATYSFNHWFINIKEQIEAMKTRLFLISSYLINRRNRTLIAAITFAIIAGRAAFAQTPNPDMAVANNTIGATAVCGNYTYIGGAFIYVGTNSGGGALVTATNSKINKSYPKAGGTIYACIPDGAGGWFIGGSFTVVDNTTRNNIAHIKSDGTLDASWNPNLDNIVFCLLLNGNDLFVGGSFTKAGGVTINRLAKLNAATGTLDATWNPNVDNLVRALAISSSSLFIGGDFTNVGGQALNKIAKVSTTGTGEVDATWNPNMNLPVLSLAVTGSSVIAGGNFTTVGGLPRNRIVKLPVTGTGTPVATWIPSANSGVNAILIDGDNIFIGGNFAVVNSVTRNRLAKLSATGAGALDEAWNPNANAIVYALAFSGSDIIATGNFTTVSGGTLPRLRCVKLSSTGTGTPDPDWDPKLSNIGYAVSVDGSNIYLGGSFSSVNVVSRNYLARINNLTGEVDETWDPNPNSTVYTILINGSYVYAGGLFTAANSGIPISRLARFSMNGAGTLDQTWNPNISPGYVNAIATDGTDIYAGGSFSTVNGSTSRDRLAKFPISGDGTTDPYWNPVLNGTVNALAISGTDIFVGGNFTNVGVGGTPRNYLASFPITGYANVNSWDPNIGGTVQALVVDGGLIYVGGSYTTVNGGTARSRLARFPVSGTATTDSWNPNISSTVNALAISGSDIYVGGLFATVNSTLSRTNLARISTSTGLADSWAPNPSNTVRSITIDGSDVYIGGVFTFASGAIQPFLALFTDRTLPVELVSFTASETNGRVKLDWQTATEVDNNGFEVERAIAGTDDWKKIGFLEGHHTTNSPKYYSFNDNPCKTSATKYKYRLNQMDNSGKHEYSNVVEVTLGTPNSFLLEQNYPNPFNPSTSIRFQLPVPGRVNLELFTSTGEKVATLLNEDMETGVHSISLNAGEMRFPSGVYFYRMTVVPPSGEVFSSVKKLSLIK